MEIKPWLSARPDCKEGRFIQVGNSFLLSEKIQNLSAGARWTYLSMAMESGGNRQFHFPLSSAKKYGISKSALSRHIIELRQANVITMQSGATVRKANRYTFVYDTWKRRETGQ